MKKVYDRDSKEYVTEEELERRKLKKRKNCKGGREHDWVEVLPYGAEAVEGIYNGDTQPFYDAENAIKEFTEKQYAALESIGIKVRARGWTPNRNYRPFACSVCHKRIIKEI